MRQARENLEIDTKYNKLIAHSHIFSIFMIIYIVVIVIIKVSMAPLYTHIKNPEIIFTAFFIGLESSTLMNTYYSSKMPKLKKKYISSLIKYTILNLTTFWTVFAFTLIAF